MNNQHRQQNLQFMFPKTLLSIPVILFFLFVCSCKTDPKTEAPTIKTETVKTVTTRLRAEPDRLNPLLTYRGWSLQVTNFIFLPLIEYDPVTLELAPVIVKSRPIINYIMDGDQLKGITYTYEILAEAAWDDGKPVLASDYIFTLKAVKNPATGAGAAAYRPYFSDIKNVVVDQDNPKKFTVITEPPYNRAEYVSGGFGILPEHIYDPNGLLTDIPFAELADAEKAAKLVETNPKVKQFGEEFTADKYSRDVVSGCGAYALESWEPNQKIVLKKKTNWWGKNLANKNAMLTANPETIIFKPISDPTATISLMRNGEIDVAASIPNTTFTELQEDPDMKANFNFYTRPTTMYNYMGLNAKNPKLTDKRVRRALAHLLDMEEVIKTVRGGMGTRIIGPIPPSSEFYHTGLKPIDLDIEKAKQLLAEAGWKDSNGNGTVDKIVNGQETELEIDYMMSPNNPVSSNIALLFQNNAKKAGIQINPLVKESNLIRQDLSKREFEIFTGAFDLGVALYDPKQNWHTSSDNPGGGNRNGFGNAESDQLIEEIRTTFDKQKLKELYFRFQEMVYDEQNMIFMYNTVEPVIVSKKISNVKLSPKTPGYFENYFK